MRTLISLAAVLLAGTCLAQPAQQGAANPADPAFVNGALTAPGAPTDSQTVPAKFSEHNAQVDGTPIMAYPLALSGEQRQRILDAVMAAPTPVSTVHATPAQELPGLVALEDLPPELLRDTPALQGMSYLKTSDGVLIVRAPTMIVVDSIKR